MIVLIIQNKQKLRTHKSKIGSHRGSKQTQSFFLIFFFLYLCLHCIPLISAPEEKFVNFFFIMPCCTRGGKQTALGAQKKTTNN
jgi:Trk-type K+ transport system membrane component